MQFIKKSIEHLQVFFRRFLGINQILEELHKVDEKNSKNNQQFLDSFIEVVSTHYLENKKYLEQDCKRTKEIIQAHFQKTEDFWKNIVEEHDKQNKNLAVIMAKIENFLLMSSQSEMATQETAKSLVSNLNDHQVILTSIQSDLRKIMSLQENNSSLKLLLEDIQRRIIFLVSDSEQNKQLFDNLEDSSKMLDEYMRLMLLNSAINQVDNILGKH